MKFRVQSSGDAQPAAAGVRTLLPCGFCSCQTRDLKEGMERRAGWRENSLFSTENRGKEKQAMGGMVDLNAITVLNKSTIAHSILDDINRLGN